MVYLFVQVEAELFLPVMFAESSTCAFLMTRFLSTVLELEKIMLYFITGIFFGRLCNCTDSSNILLL